MTAIHRIRLGPPWEVTPLGNGRFRHTRKFGRPRTLDEDERLFLVCDDLPAPPKVFVNGVEQKFPAYDITALLQPRNEVVIELKSDVPLSGVRLEVWPANKKS